MPLEIFTLFKVCHLTHRDVGNAKATPGELFVQTRFGLNRRERFKTAKLAFGEIKVTEGNPFRERIS